MSLSTDLFAAATSVEIVAQYPNVPEHVTKRLLHLAETLCECSARAAVLEQKTVPPHWRQQPLVAPHNLGDNVLLFDRRRRNADD